MNEKKEAEEKIAQILREFEEKTGKSVKLVGICRHYEKHTVTTVRTVWLEVYK
jgi:hypothetical protein